MDMEVRPVEMEPINIAQPVLGIKPLHLKVALHRAVQDLLQHDRC